MKLVGYLLLGVMMCGCGPKSNEEKAMAAVTENLRTTLPDFSKYSSLNFGPLGTASLPYEETSEYLLYKKAMVIYSDSILALQKILATDSSAANKQRLQQLQDSSAAKKAAAQIVRQGYTPEKLYKITHAYTLTDKDGNDKKTESAFYINKDFSKVVKVEKLY
jgi:hypothetical protein